MALELTEALTQVALAGVPDGLYQRVREHFSEKQFMDLVILISTINSWNRIAIAAGTVPSEKARG